MEIQVALNLIPNMPHLQNDILYHRKQSKRVGVGRDESCMASLK